MYSVLYNYTYIDFVFCQILSILILVLARLYLLFHIDSSYFGQACVLGQYNIHANHTSFFMSASQKGQIECISYINTGISADTVNQGNNNQTKWIYRFYTRILSKHLNSRRIQMKLAQMDKEMDCELWRQQEVCLSCPPMAAKHAKACYDHVAFPGE